MNQKENNFVLMGEIVNTHGIRGDIKVKVEPNNFDFDISKQKHFYVFEKNDFVKIDISNIRVQKNIYLVKPTDFNNINLIEKYKGSLIYIEFDNLKSNEYFYHELFGYTIIHGDESMGVIDNFYLQGSFYSFTLKGNNDLTFPINDKFIEKIDKKKMEVYVRFPEGYL